MEDYIGHDESVAAADNTAAPLGSAGDALRPRQVMRDLNDWQNELYCPTFDDDPELFAGIFPFEFTSTGFLDNGLDGNFDPPHDTGLVGQCTLQPNHGWNTFPWGVVDREQEPARHPAGPEWQLATDITPHHESFDPSHVLSFTDLPSVASLQAPGFDAPGSAFTNESSSLYPLPTASHVSSSDPSTSPTSTTPARASEHAQWESHATTPSPSTRGHRPSGKRVSGPSPLSETALKQPAKKTGTYICAHCPHRAWRRCDLNKHVRRKHEVPPYPCHSCNKRFHYPKDVRRHRESCHHVDEHEPTEQPDERINQFRMECIDLRMDIVRSLLVTTDVEFFAFGQEPVIVSLGRLLRLSMPADLAEGCMHGGGLQAVRSLSLCDFERELNTLEAWQKLSDTEREAWVNLLRRIFQKLQYRALRRQVAVDTERLRWSTEQLANCGTYDPAVDDPLFDIIDPESGMTETRASWRGGRKLLVSFRIRHQRLTWYAIGSVEVSPSCHLLTELEQSLRTLSLPSAATTLPAVDLTAQRAHPCIKSDQRYTAVQPSENLPFGYGMLETMRLCLFGLGSSRIWSEMRAFVAAFGPSRSTDRKSRRSRTLCGDWAMWSIMVP